MGAAFSLFLLAVICLGVAWWVSLLPGIVTATIAGTTIEASTPVALTLIVALFLVLYFVIRLLAWLFSLPRRGRRWRAGRNRERGDTAVNRALVALAAGDAGAARREAERSRRLLGDTPLTLLLAAQAGRQAGRDEEAEAALRQLAESRDGRLLGLRGLLRLAVQRQDWDEAARLATEAERVHPGAAWLRDERRQMALRKGEWSEALRLAAPEQKAAVALGAAAAETDPDRALSLSKQAFAADPALAPAALDYARRLRDHGRERAAQDVLRKAWSARPHPDIADEYVRGAPDKLARARQMAELARANPEHPETHLALARAALEAGLTSEARQHLARVQSMAVNERRVWQLLADIEATDGHAEAAQEAMSHLAEAAPDPAWRCAACATRHEHWHPVCEACGAVGTIAWGASSVPARLAQPEVVEGLTG
jgi:HemY protein